MRHHTAVLPAACAALVAPLISAPVYAAPQEGAPVPPTAAPAAPAAPTAPKNLFEALPNLRWDAAQNGPLIIVVPQAATPTKPIKRPGQTEETALPPFPPLVSGAYRTTDLLEYFGRRIVRLRGVTVFAPAQMVVLNTNLGKPDLYDRMSFTDKLQILEASLTPGQWQAMASPNGLGMSDLAGEQRDLFNALLPNPFMYTVSPAPTGVEMMVPTVKRDPPEKRTVTDSQRNGIRLRINRETTLFSPSVDPASPFDIGFVPKDVPGTPLLSLAPEDNTKRVPGRSYGVTLSQTVESYLKKGQIDFEADALKVPVAFADATTVGELIRRIREATRVDLYVDRRLALLPVTILAAPEAQLRAGELLKALCWSVTGAVRYVREESDSSAAAGVFILTDDVEGLGTRWGRITDWTMASSSAEYGAKRRRDRVIRGKKVLDNIGFAPDEAYMPTPEQKARIEKGWTDFRSRFLGVQFPISTLPPELQERAKQTAQETNALRAKNTSERAPKRVSEEMVSISVRLGAHLEIPDVGKISVTLYQEGGLDSFLPEAEFNDPQAAQPPAKTIMLPPNLKAGGVLSITAVSEAEARDAVRAARERGLRQVWIAAPPEREDPSQATTDAEFQRILTAAVSEAQQGNEKSIDVLAVARVLSVPVRSKNTLPIDLNVKGQSVGQAAQERLEFALLVGEDTRAQEKASKEARDWLLPDDPAVVKQVVARLGGLARTPGISGVVLTDIMAPGYRVPKGSGRNFGENYAMLGYTAKHRIDAIRAFGCDPVDIALDRGYISYDAPGPFLIEGTAQRIAAKIASQSKAPVDPTKTDDLATLAESSPLTAWNALRFRSAKALTDRIYDALATVQKQQMPYAIYMQDLVAGNQWFSTWDQKDKLPIALERREDENFSASSVRSARAASATNLSRVGYFPSADPGDPNSTTDAPPLPPAEKFARDFNDTVRRSKATWDGYVFDLRDLPFPKALEVLQAVTPPKAPDGAARRRN